MSYSSLTHFKLGSSRFELDLQTSQARTPNITHLFKRAELKSGFQSQIKLRFNNFKRIKPKTLKAQLDLAHLQPYLSLFYNVHMVEFVSGDHPFNNIWIN